MLFINHGKTRPVATPEDLDSVAPLKNAHRVPTFVGASRRRIRPGQAASQAAFKGAGSVRLICRNRRRHRGLWRRSGLNLGEAKIVWCQFPDYLAEPFFALLAKVHRRRVAPI
jgi:hypothetical protein